MKKEIKDYHKIFSKEEQAIFKKLYEEIDSTLKGAENKIWHRHPVWFLDGNPIAGYSKLKDGIRLLFWSGASFDEEDLKPGTGKFKDASFTYTSAEDIITKDLKRWLTKSKEIQWDYNNVVKRKGVLVRLK
jgi:hypothetical protein